MIDVLSAVYKLSVTPAIIENGEGNFWRFVAECIGHSNLEILSLEEDSVNLEVRKAVLKFNRLLKPQLDVFQIERLINALSHPTQDLIEFAKGRKRYEVTDEIEMAISNFKSIKSRMIAKVYNPQNQLVNLYKQSGFHPIGALKSRMRSVLTLCENDRELFNYLLDKNPIELGWLYDRLGVELPNMES